MYPYIYFEIRETDFGDQGLRGEYRKTSSSWYTVEAKYLKLECMLSQNRTLITPKQHWREGSTTGIVSCTQTQYSSP